MHLPLSTLIYTYGDLCIYLHAKEHTHAVHTCLHTHTHISVSWDRMQLPFSEVKINISNFIWFDLNSYAHTCTNIHVFMQMHGLPWWLRWYKESACNAGDLGSIPGLGDPLEQGMVTHSSILAWRISMGRGA